MRFTKGRQRAEVSEDTLFRVRYGQAVRELASALMVAAAANAELEKVMGAAGLTDLKTRAELPAPWIELHLGGYKGADTRLDSWLRFTRDKGFL